MVLLSFDPVKKVKRPSRAFISALERHINQILIRLERENNQCSLLFCDNAFIQDLNKRYRSKDYPTDVLSFAQDEGEVMPSGEECLGDVIVSAEMALSQSEEYQISYEEELARLSTHGVLHLLGYDHEQGEEAEKKMLSLQDELMDAFMLSYAGIESSRI